MSENAKFLMVRNHKVTEDVNGHICLNDLWKIAGSPSSKAPSYWKRLPVARELIEAVDANMRKSHIRAESTKNSAIYSKKGNGGGTYAHAVLALSYAEYLSPELAIDVNTVYLRFRSGDVQLADEILAKAEEARKWNGTRDASKAAREYFTGVLHDHDCDGSDIGYVTNAIYVVLLGGKASQVKSAMSLPSSANLRDNLPLKQLVQTMATEVMAGERIADENRCGRHECYYATSRAASFVKDAFDREAADRQRVNM